MNERQTEVLQLLSNASSSMTGQQIYGHATLFEDEKQLANGLFHLRSAGYVESQPLSTNGKRVAYSITEAGRKALVDSGKCDSDLQPKTATTQQENATTATTAEERTIPGAQAPKSSTQKAGVREAKSKSMPEVAQSKSPEFDITSRGVLTISAGDKAVVLDHGATLALLDFLHAVELVLERAA